MTTQAVGLLPVVELPAYDREMQAPDLLPDAGSTRVPLSFVLRHGLLFGLVGLLLSGCSSRLYIPGNRFLSPESSGRLLAGDVKIGGVGVTHVQVADDITSATPDTTPVLLSNSSLLIGAQLGLLPPLDMYFTSAAGGAAVLGGKLQLVGDSAAEAKAGNLSVTVAGGIVTGNRDQSVETSGLKGRSTIDFSGWEGLFSVGYRTSDSALLYLSPFVSRTKARVNIERTAGGTTSTTAEPHGFGDMKGVSLGLRLGKTYFLAMEGSVTETQWTRTQPSELKSERFVDKALGLGVGGSW